MKRVLLTSGMIALGLGAQVQAETFAQRVEAAMAAQGYTDIEIEMSDGKLKVEGRKDGMEVETVYLAATEEVLSHEVEEDDEDHEDEHDDDHEEDGSDHDDDNDGNDDADDDDHDDGDGHDDDDNDDD